MGKGTNLKDFLKANKLTIKELSEKTGISLNTLYSITKRDSEISAEIMSKIANSLNISTDELSKLLSNNKEGNSDTESIPGKSRILDSKIDKNFPDTEELIEQLNILTKDYMLALQSLKELKIQKVELAKQREFINEKMQAIDMKLCLLENDVQNRQTELELIRRKIEQKHKL